MTRREFGAALDQPYFGPQGLAAGAQQNSVFRAYRYSEEEIARARTA